MSVKTKFDMYLAPPSRAAFAALADWMHAAMAGVTDGQDPVKGTTGDFVVGQVCGITLATAPPGRFHYLATPVMDDDAVPAGHYNSLIIAPREGGIDQLAEFDPARHRAVINEPGSFSGAITFTAHLRKAVGHELITPLLSGCHLASVAMVAAGRAQLAAIDRVSFALAGATRPGDVAAVQVIDETAFYPGLPFVADGALPSDAVARLRDRLLDFRSHPAWREMAEILRLRDLTILDAADYDIMATIGMPRPGS
ncbi:MAG: phosphate/phosphite/phosphonate ABC transporter substrate-binding protein [Candidatus Puniceispirillaceae bacterium]|jgi:ABC-type phosphate/phosphonate transport system substrate-binding protein